MATTTVPAGVQMIALQEIRTDGNVRQQLLAEEVDALAQSIKLLGQLTPVSVRPAEGGGYVLIAGHKRCAALSALGETQVRAEIRPHGSQEESERAAENIVRSGLNPYEEAVAVRAMLDRGLTVDGAAQALGWNRARVTARVKLLELPELAQQMFGEGRLPLSSVEQLRAIGAVSPALLEALIDYLADGNEWAAERLTREPGWVLDSALHAGNSNVFAAHLGGRVDSYEIALLKLGKKAEAAYERAGELTRVLDRYAYSVDVRFDESDVDQARAAGVVIEFERSAPIIVDRSLYRELVKAAIIRTVAELEAKVAAREEERKAARQSQKTNGAPADPAAEVEREHRRRMRELSDQAHGVNLDVGAGLLNGLSTMDPTDVNVAKFFVLGRHRPSTNWADVATMPIRLPARAPIRRRSLGESARRHNRTSGETRVCGGVGGWPCVSARAGIGRARRWCSDRRSRGHCAPDGRRRARCVGAICARHARRGPVQLALASCELPECLVARLDAAWPESLAAFRFRAAMRSFVVIGRAIHV